MLRFLGGLIDRVICTAIAILFAQAPSYVDQYEAVLVRTQQELESDIATIEEQAEENGESVENFLDRLANSEDSLLRTEGRARLNKLESYQEVTQLIDTLRTIPKWQRPWWLYSNWNPSYDQAVNYQPMIPLHEVGLLYAIVGLLSGMLIAYLLRLLFRSIWKPKKGNLYQ